MQSGSIDGGVGGEYSGLGLVDIAKYLWHRMTFFYAVAPRKYVGFIDDNTDELYWNMITGSCLSRREINNAGHVSLP